MTGWLPLKIYASVPLMRWSICAHSSLKRIPKRNRYDKRKKSGTSRSDRRDRIVNKAANYHRAFRKNSLRFI